MDGVERSPARSRCSPPAKTTARSQGPSRPAAAWPAASANAPGGIRRGGEADGCADGHPPTVLSARRRTRRASRRSRGSEATEISFAQVTDVSVIVWTTLARSAGESRREQPLGAPPGALAPQLDQLERPDLVERDDRQVDQAEARVVVAGDELLDPVEDAGVDLVDRVVVGLAAGARKASRGPSARRRTAGRAGRGRSRTAAPPGPR